VLPIGYVWKDNTFILLSIKQEATERKINYIVYNKSVFRFSNLNPYLFLLR
jgi:hypothetical protein